VREKARLKKDFKWRDVRGARIFFGTGDETASVALLVE